MQVSVKKKINPEVASFADTTAELPQLIKRDSPTEPVAAPIAAPAPKVEVAAAVTATATTTTAATAATVSAEASLPKVEVVKKATPKRPSILNLGELLSEGDKKQVAESGVTQKESVTDADPLSEQKLTAAKDAILDHLREWRPRFVAVFEPMSFSGNTISIVVPTTELREEILRSRTELLTKVVELSGVTGAVDIAIEVNEVAKSLKPIKLEDRIAHIMGLNPLIVELKEALDLDVEG